MISNPNCDCGKYCNLNNRIIDHVNNDTIHVTKEDKETWNSKVSKDQLDQGMQDLQQKITDSSTTIDNKLKDYQKIQDMIKYSTLEYVNSEFAKLNKKCGQCVSSDQVDSLYNELVGNDKKLSSLLSANYYTKKDIDSKIPDTNYAITDLSVNDNVLSLTQNAVGQLSVKLPTSSSEYDDQHIQELLKNYALLNNRKTIIFKSGDSTILYDPFGSANRTISLDSSVSVGKYVWYYQNTTSNTIIPLVPDTGKLPSEYASSTEQGKWNKICPVRNSGEYTWQVQVYMNAAGVAEDWTSPVCITSKDGSQELKGAPLRDRGEWVIGTIYYDGTISSNNVFYQDFVKYKNVHYACVDTQIGISEDWQKTPDESEAFTPLSMNRSMFESMLIASKAYIKELSSKEIVVFEGDKIVAGMTSSGAITQYSDLDGRVAIKGDVRIWAGEMQTEGNLTSAATTISDTGVIISQNKEQGKYIEINPNQCSLKMVGPTATQDGTVLPQGDDRTTLVDFSFNIDDDSRTSYPVLKLANGGEDEYISLCPNPNNTPGIRIKGFGDTVYSTAIENGIINLDGTGQRKIMLDTRDGTPYSSIAQFYYSDSVYVDVSCKHTEETTANKLLFVLKGLPTSDPGVSGALYTDSSGNLKVSI